MIEVEWINSKGRLRKTSWDYVKVDMKRFGLSWEDAHSRRKWRSKIKGKLWCVTPQSGNRVSTSLSNSGLCWTVFARNRDTAVPAEGNGDLQTLICVLVARPRRCPTLSNRVPWQNWMVAYLSYTLRMKMLFRGWPVMVHDTHTRRRRRDHVAKPGSLERWLLSRRVSNANNYINHNMCILYQLTVGGLA